MFKRGKVLKISLAAAVIITSSGVWTAAAVPLTPEQAVLAAEDAYAKALVNHDAAALSNLLAPEWTSGNESGKLHTVGSLQSALTSGKLVISSIVNHDLKLTVLGQAVLVQGMDDETTPSQGKVIGVTRSWLDVWVLRMGRWVMVASQDTVVNKPTD